MKKNWLFGILGLTLAGCSSIEVGGYAPYDENTVENRLPEEERFFNENSNSGLLMPEPEMDNYSLSDNGMVMGNGESIFNEPFVDRYKNPITLSPYYNLPSKSVIGMTNPNDTALTVSNASRFIVVNIPSQTLRAFENGQEIIRSKLILGKPTNRTPTQKSRITSLKLNPDWHAPVGGGIERTYTRKLREGGAEELKAIHISWRNRGNGTYQFYQPSGPNNVLGRVKFEMYSPSNTYLHDTNRPDLFNLNERFFSFGCIRVQEWDSLAAWMLGWDKYKFMDYLLTNPQMHHKNIDPVDIHIVYWTNEIVDGHNRVWPDIYSKN